MAYCNINRKITKESAHGRCTNFLTSTMQTERQCNTNGYLTLHVIKYFPSTNDSRTQNLRGPQSSTSPPSVGTAKIHASNKKKTKKKKTEQLLL